MAKHFIYLLSLVLFTFFSCRKDIGKLPIPLTEETSKGADYDTADFTCLDMPNWMLWKDTTADPAKNVNHWQYNPANPDEVIYVCDIAQIWCYNFKTRQRTHIADNIMYKPQINRLGWIVFNTLSFDTYKVKTNGDSLTQLTFDGGTDPKWDYTDTAIYYFREAPAGHPNYLIKINRWGKKLDSIKGSNTEGLLHNAYSKISNKMVYQKINNNNQRAIYFRDLATGTETMIIQSGGGWLTVDNKDEYIYWGGADGIIKCNIKTGKTDTIFNKLCPNYSFGGTISANCDKYTASLEKYIPKYNHRLFLEYKTFEFDLSKPGHSLKEVKLFP